MPDLQMLLAMKYFLLLTELKKPHKMKHLCSSKTTFVLVLSTKQNTNSLDYPNLNMIS